jgi:hypothetical protein
MDWKKIKFDDYKGKPLIYTKPKKLASQNWKNIGTFDKYNIDIYDKPQTKHIKDFKESEYENYKMEWPSMKHGVEYSLSIIKNEEKIDFLMSSKWRGDISPDGEDEHRRFFIEIKYKQKTYNFEYSTMYNSVSLTYDKFSFHLNNKYSLNNLYNKIGAESDIIYDVLVIFDKRIQRLKYIWTSW